MMITCSTCKHQEMVGSLFCSECGAQLTAIEGQITESFDPPFEADQTQNAAEPPSDELPPDAQVALYVSAFDTCLYLKDIQEYSLGRVNEGQKVVPDIDLTDFDAYKYGISRLHASVSILKERVEIRDLGSSNGTLLNGLKLVPHVPYPLTDGDMVVFGKLQMHVIMKRAD